MRQFDYDEGYQQGYDAALSETRQPRVYRRPVEPVYDEYEDEFYEEEPVYIPRSRPMYTRPCQINYEPKTEEIAIPTQGKSNVLVYAAAGVVVFLVLMIVANMTNVAQKAMYPSSHSTASVQSKPVHQSSGNQDDLSVVGQPSISQSTINSVLAQYHSPLSGQTIYDYGVQYNIDPAFALAFFVHESGAGTQGAAVAHLNPGNLRSSPLENSHDGFAYFADWNTGIHAWYELISSNLYVGGGLTTVYEITNKYAPSADANDPQGYAEAVIQTVKDWRS